MSLLRKILGLRDITSRRIGTTTEIGKRIVRGRLPDREAGTEGATVGDPEILAEASQERKRSDILTFTQRAPDQSLDTAIRWNSMPWPSFQ